MRFLYATLASCAALGSLPLATAQAQGQFSVGVRLGAQHAWVTEKLTPSYFQEPLAYKTNLNGLAGVVLNVQFSHLTLQPALLFAQKGWRAGGTTSGVFYNAYTNWERSSYTIRYQSKGQLNYLELPLNLIVSTGKTDGFQLVAGAYVAYALGGHYKRTSETDEKYGTGFDSVLNAEERASLYFGRGSYNNTNDYGYNAFDAGLNAGLGYKLAAWQVQATYSAGLRTILADQPAYNGTQPHRYNRTVQLNTTYFFGR